MLGCGQRTAYQFWTFIAPPLTGGTGSEFTHVLHSYFSVRQLLLTDTDDAFLLLIHAYSLFDVLNTVDPSKFDKPSQCP